MQEAAADWSISLASWSKWFCDGHHGWHSLNVSSHHQHNNTKKHLSSRMFIWSINNADIAHLTFYKSPPGAFSMSLCAGVHMMSVRPSCCPLSGEPVSSWVMAPSSDRLFLRLQNTHKDNGAHVGHTSSRHKHIFSWYYTNRQRMRHLHRGLLQGRL